MEVRICDAAVRGEVLGLLSRSFIDITLVYAVRFTMASGQWRMVE
jgi:hypothetical protein